MIRRPPRSTPFPTRRSSDLPRSALAAEAQLFAVGDAARDARADAASIELERALGAARGFLRSEEHTSELQSQSNFVCRPPLVKTYCKCSIHLLLIIHVQIRC